MSSLLTCCQPKTVPLTASAVFHPVNDTEFLEVGTEVSTEAIDPTSLPPIPKRRDELLPALNLEHVEGRRSRQQELDCPNDMMSPASTDRYTNLCSDRSETGGNDKIEGNDMMPVQEDFAVFLHVYDLFWWVRLTNAAFFHVGIEAHGQEVYFGSSGVRRCKPGTNPHYRHRKRVFIGSTPLTKEQMKALRYQFARKWKGEDYNPIARNCHSFANEFALGLCPTLDSFPTEYTPLSEGLPNCHPFACFSRGRNAKFVVCEEEDSEILVLEGNMPTLERSYPTL
eukprot:TRINITY_DN70743_c0_g1_i1.p1 TRINITY_DN70743_c0_g1~~TRINITY_DN70743_c0_g1_i1.p1  ORF type:complete len:283 (-),score=24.63 TRINITY_DN70743_c0_g1_i1:27-875(-)